MAGFSLRRRKFAPSGVALEASHEAAGAGLVAGFMFGPGSNSLIDLCGNQWIELFRHAHAVNPLTGKPALVCTNATSRMQLPNGLRLLSRTAGSVAISSRITGYVGVYPRRLQTQNDSMFQLARFAADNQVGSHLFGSNVNIPTTAPYYTTGQSVMGLSWDASHPTIKRGLYREGVLVGSSGTAPGSGTEDRYIQLDGGAGEVDWMFFFDRAVDQQALFDDPMALVKARRQVLYFDAGGAGGVNLSGTTAAQAGANADLTVQTAHDLAGDAAAQASAAGALIINSVFAESQFAAANNTDLAAAEAGWTRTALMGVGYLGVDVNQLYGSSAGTSALYVRNEVAPSADYTVELAVSAMAANLGGSTVGVVGRYVGEQYYGARYAGVAGQYELFKFELFGGGTTTLGSFAASIANGATVTIGLRMVGDEIAALVDGVAVIEVTDAAVVNPGQAGAFAVTGNPAHWRADNFQAVLIASGTGTVDLAAAAAAQSAASAGLTLAVPIAGAGIALATTGGALAIGIPLAGAAAGQSDAPGVLTVTGNTDLAGNAVVQPAAGGGLHLTVPLSASAVTAALAAAGLTQSVPLAGDAAGSAQAPGELSVGVGLAGGDAAQAGASGTLTLNVSLAGNPIATAAAAAGLTVAGSSYLAGAAVANPAASGVLTHGVPLAGAALTVSGAQGSLTRIVPLASASASASIATGGLDLRVELAVDALVQALAGASLDVQGNAGLAGDAAAQAGALATLALRINLAADAVARAVAAGALAGDGTLAGVPGLIVSRRPRSWRARGEARAWRVAQATRIWRAA